MLNKQDITARNIVVVNALEGKKFNISLSNIVVSDINSGEILTKLSCYKVFAIFVVGHLTITSQVLDVLHRYGVSLVLMKPNFRPFFCFGITAEANYLLRERQYKFTGNLELACIILKNKSVNQINVLKNIRNKTEHQKSVISRCNEMISQMKTSNDMSLSKLMGLEGNITKLYFGAVFDFEDWNGRKPRAKLDPYNVVLDIGYTFLFNLVECFVRLFGFDVYYGVCHQTWFKRKSLICDLVEPFRCIVDAQVRKSWNLQQFTTEHFTQKNGQFVLLDKHMKDYTQIFFSELANHKLIIFDYIRNYYRCFMGKKSVPNYPWFNSIRGELDYVNN